MTALFPLHTVLVPGGLLPLRLFETRYLDLVSECLREDKGFGVILIEQGSEVGAPPDIFTTGTYARIIDWQQNLDGLLGITIEGQRRFRVLDSKPRSNQLLEARITWLEEGEDKTVSALKADIIPWLKQIADSIPLSLTDESGRDRTAGWASYRLLELLPLEMPIKQRLLEIDDPVQRLETLYTLFQDEHS